MLLQLPKGVHLVVENPVNQIATERCQKTTAQTATKQHEKAVPLQQIQQTYFTLRPQANIARIARGI